MQSHGEKDDCVFQLAGSNEEEAGGLVIMTGRKCVPGEEFEFKAPLPKSSIFGLDKLAEERRKHRSRGVDEYIKKTKRQKCRDEEDNDIQYKNRNDSRRLHSSSSKKRRHEESDRKSYDKHSSGSSRRSISSSHSQFKDDPSTPNIRVKDTPSRSGWDDDDDHRRGRNHKNSEWDGPTPKIHHSYDSTPKPTPAYKYNKWIDNRKKTGATPATGRDDLKWGKHYDREEWIEEDERIDRQWYHMDEGWDADNNIFSNISEEYVKKKEQQIQQNSKKRMSAQQREISRDNELWEVNRMVTSGVVISTHGDGDVDDENAARVHLLVQNIVPPFLDGRIVFTKQPEPVIPVRDPTSDMAIIAKKGSLTVRKFREQKERRKAQKKHWEVAGTAIGNIMGITKKDDAEDEDKEDEKTDYKSSQTFAQHMSEKQEASSDFAKKKTIAQQRTYLPAFAVRQEV